MPNIKSAKKRVKVIKKKTLRNNIQRSILRTSVRKFKEAFANKASNIDEVFKDAMKAVDRAVSKKVLHRNTAARIKSKLAKKHNKRVSE